jgi:hypothetical protein
VVPERPTPFNIWNLETLCDPSDGFAYANPHYSHNEVNVGKAPAHVADEASRAIASLMETERWIRIAVPMIFCPPTMGAFVPDSHA